VSFHHFSFLSSDYLWALLAVPVLFLFAWYVRRRRTRYTVTFTNLGTLAGVAAKRRPRWRRLVPIVLLGIALALLAAALARPRVMVVARDKSSTIILLVDVSDSMRATDIYPNRLNAAVTAMHTFVDELPANDKVGLVTFSDKVQVLGQPTTDHQVIHTALDVLSPKGGTALGDGVGAAVKIIVDTLAEQGVHRDPNQYLPGAIVLESDGAQNRGHLTSFAAAELARTTGVRIYGVALGSRSAYIKEGQGLFAVRIHVPPDRGVVGLLARESGGQAYDASNARTLNQIYKHLGTTLGRRYQPKEITSWFELAAAIFLVAAIWTARARGAALP
jgi:Ca-activated chloride channel family protein